MHPMGHAAMLVQNYFYEWKTNDEESSKQVTKD
jgi:hypothetical protein